MSEHNPYAPVLFFEYDHRPGHYCTMLSDHHMVEVAELFEAAGYMGGGYDWEAIARQSVRAFAPELEGCFGTDPEAGTFAAYGKDEAALRKLAELLHDAFHDRDRLARLIADAEPDWFD